MATTNARDIRKASNRARFALTRTTDAIKVLALTVGKRETKKLVGSILANPKLQISEADLDLAIRSKLGYAKPNGDGYQRVRAQKAGARIAREKARQTPKTAPVLSEPDMKQVSDAEVFAAIARQAS